MRSEVERESKLRPQRLIVQLKWTLIRQFLRMLNLLYRIKAQRAATDQE